MTGTMVFPFKGKNHSGTYDVNLLYKEKNIYVMDNHLAALWCWFQEISQGDTYGFLHIDRHYDATKLTQKQIDFTQDMWGITFNDYLNQLDPETNNDIQLMRWDNYISLFYQRYSDITEKIYFATHKDGDDPIYIPYATLDIWENPQELDFWLGRSGTSKWIVNIDLDYFFYSIDFEDFEMF